MMEIEQEEDQGGLRVDGRRALELRQIRVRMGVFGQADGSAYLEHGKTKILAAVYGPHQVKFVCLRLVKLFLFIWHCLLTAQRCIG